MPIQTSEISDARKQSMHTGWACGIPTTNRAFVPQLTPIHPTNGRFEALLFKVAIYGYGFGLVSAHEIKITKIRWGDYTHTETHTKTLTGLSFDKSSKRHTLSDIRLPPKLGCMTTMTSPRFTMRLDTELKDWLETEAKRRDRSAAYLAKQAIQALKDKTEAKAQMIRAAVAEADKGVFISEEKMNAWMDSWDTDNELSPPEPDIFPQQS